MGKKVNFKLLANQFKRSDRKIQLTVGGCALAAIGLLIYWIYNIMQIPVVFG